MRIQRYPENPLITPADVKPSIDGWEVMCVFNAGVIEFGDEILLLMRVAERPRSNDPNKVLVPIMECADGKPQMKILKFWQPLMVHFSVHTQKLIFSLTDIYSLRVS